jgi:hypothetical protein
MAILSAAVEDNGWVLRVEGTWPASTFASFDLDPNGAPKISITTTSAGFDRSGSTAVANSARARTGVVGTKPLRRPYFPGYVETLDETDLGGGVRRIRIALSRYVYPGDPVSVTFAAGWRAGQGGGTATCTNNSTHAVRMPSARWATPAYFTENGPFRIDLLVANIEAEGLSAVAAVKVKCYDGTNTQEFWLTESVSNRFGDNLKCWGATINPTSLTAGLITLHWEVYPWIGAMRTSGSAHVADAEQGFSVDVNAPLHVCWDPDGTRYGQQHIFIDPILGTTTPGNVTIGATLAAAKAGTPAANQFVALNAIQGLNRTLPAANGMAGGTRSADGAILTFKAGTHQIATGTNFAGLGTYEGRCIWQGDPDDPNPRANVILRTTDAITFSPRITRSLMRNMTFELGGSISASMRWHWDNCELRGRVGNETSTGGVSSGATSPFIRLSFTNSRYWRHGAPLSGLGWPCGLLRNLQFNRSITSAVIVNCERIEDATVPTGGRGTFGTFWSVTDTFIWGTKAFYQDNGGFTFGNSVVGTVTSANPNLYVRGNIVNCIFERNAPSVEGAFWQSDGNTRLVDCLIEGSTFVGARINWGYDDPADGVTPINSTGNCLRNIHVDRLPTKHDIFTLNANLVSGWANLYGVNSEGNTVIHRNMGIHRALRARVPRRPVPADQGAAG